MTRADLKHCGKMSDAREELDRSLREGRRRGADSKTMLCFHHITECSTTTSSHDKILQKIIMMIMVISKWYFSREHIALSYKNR